MKNFQKALKAYVLSILFLTQLRGVLTFLMPFASKSTNILFESKLNKKIVHPLIGCAIISSFVGVLTSTVDLENIFLYMWLTIPLFMIQASSYRFSPKSYVSWPIFFKIFQKVLIFIDIIGMICLFVVYKTQDDFGRAYGDTFKGVSGLALVNGIVSLYYISKLLKSRLTKNESLLAGFFFISHILCFSALTTICLLITLVVYFITKISIRNLIYGVLIIVTSIGTIKIASPETIDYNVTKLSYILYADSDKARKVFMYSNYLKYLETEFPRSILCGCGPGGFNSRATFLLNDDANNPFTDILGQHKPKFHEKYIHPLWDLEIVSYEKYNDGASNKPFSSMVGIAAELGLFALIFIIVVWIIYCRKLLIKSKNDFEYFFLFLMNVFMIISLFTEYWLQSTEYLLFLLIQGSLLSCKYLSKS